MAAFALPTPLEARQLSEVEGHQLAEIVLLDDTPGDVEHVAAAVSRPQDESEELAVAQGLDSVARQPFARKLRHPPLLLLPWPPCRP